MIFFRISFELDVLAQLIFISIGVGVLLVVVQNLGTGRNLDQGRLVLLHLVFVGCCYDI